MAKWVDNIRTGRVGGRGIIEEMETKGKLKNGEEIFYGAGLGMGEYRGVRTAGHSGQTGAFKTELVYCPDEEVGVVILANAASVTADRMAREVLDLYMGDPLEPQPENAEGEAETNKEPPFIGMDPSRFDPFLGGYRLEADPSVVCGVAREGDKLVGILVGTGTDFFQSIGEAEFETPTRSCRLKFIGAEDGRAEPATDR
jgi:hypothetical protein